MKNFRPRKKYLWLAGILIAGIMAINGFCQYYEVLQHAVAGGPSAEDKVAEGRAYLAAHDLRNAHISFGEAVSTDPTHPAANFFYSVTRILTTINDPVFNTLLDRSGVSAGGRDLYNWTAHFQRDAENNIVLPAGTPTSGEIIDFLRDVLLPQVEGALHNLEVIDRSFNLLLSPAETLADKQLEVDYGDIAFYRSLLHAAKSSIMIAEAYDLDVNIRDIVDKIKNDRFSLNSDILGAYVNFLNLKVSHSPAEAKISLRASIDSYLEASDFIRNETDPQGDDLIVFDPEDLEREAKFRNVLGDIRKSLDGAAMVGDQEVDHPFLLDLTQFFDNPVNIRSYLPQFTQDNEIVPCSIPDPAFGGILPGYDLDILNNLAHLPVPVSGTITCANWTAGNIVVGAFDSPSAGGDPADSASFPLPGPYSLNLQAGKTSWILACWDRDSDGILSPGDYYGSYPGNPVNVVSENCSGARNININLSDQVIGIKGTVTGGGEPVGNVGIGVYTGKCWQGSVGWEYVEENGRWTLNFLPETPVYVYLSAWPSGYITGWWDGSGFTSNCNQAAPVTPSAGQTVINFVLQLGGSISGHVTDIQGKGIPGLSVSAYDRQNYNWAGYGQTGLNGEYSVRGLPTGTYAVYVYGGQDYRDTYYNGKQSLTKADPVSVTVGQESPGINFVLARKWRGDFDYDGDVDGSDLAMFATGGTGITLEAFAAEFGGTNWLGVRVML